MSDGDETPAESDADSIVLSFEIRLETAADALESAETEDDLDRVELTLQDIESDLESAEIPVPDSTEEDEEPEDPAVALEEELTDLKDAVAEKRGPYGSDVNDRIDEVRQTITETRWAEEGETELVPSVQGFLDTVAPILDGDFGTAVADTEELSATLESVTERIEQAQLDPDADAEKIADLLDAANELEDAVDAATAWTDLEIRERLDREGFYEPIEGAKHKDFPPEWSALKAWEKRGNVEMVVLLLDLMGDTDYIARHCIEALEYMGDEEGLDPLVELANRRNLNAIEAIGKIGADAGIEALEGHAETERQTELQARSLIALGAIGSDSVTQTVANQLTAANERVQSAAARALGMIGDTRAVDPIVTFLEDETVDGSVRASAAWALREIGTETALTAAAEFTGDSSYLVDQQATKAANALELAEGADVES